MSNDITHLQGEEGMEQLEGALILRGKIATLVENLQHLLDAKRPPPVRVRRLSQQPFHSHSTILTRDQLELYNAAKLDGLYDLSTVARDHVQRRLDDVEAGADDGPDPKTNKKDKRKCHRHLLDDYEKNGWKRMGWVILGIHREVLCSLIHGNLISREYADADMSKSTHDSTRLHALPSMYLLQIVNDRVVRGETHPYPGRGLSWREWKRIIATADAISNRIRNKDYSGRSLG